MGMTLIVAFDRGVVPDWQTAKTLLEAHRHGAEMRMIDGELALPTEMPGNDWQELRLGMSAGMVTVRREDRRVSLVVWHNADAQMLRDRDMLAWAFAAAGDGRVQTEDGPLDAAAFARNAGLPSGTGQNN